LPKLSTTSYFTFSGAKRRFISSKKDLDSLFTGGKTTALTHTINGLDDFELIAFLVIQDAE
jgi:hypothetical protein